MRNRFFAACLTLATVEVAVADAPPGPAPSASPWSAWAHTRPLSPGAIELLDIAADRSAIVAGLLEDIERTDLIVYITDSMPGVFTGPKSTMVFLSGDSSLRYLLIRVDSMRLPLPERIAALGHELQHAMEVAAAPEVKSASGMAELYRRIGWETSKGRFESQAAQTVAFRITKQLGQRNKPHRLASSDETPRSTAVGGPSQQ
jgi:hypothetical protein